MLFPGERDLALGRAPELVGSLRVGRVREGASQFSARQRLFARFDRWWECCIVILVRSLDSSLSGPGGVACGGSGSHFDWRSSV